MIIYLAMIAMIYYDLLWFIMIYLLNDHQGWGLNHQFTSIYHRWRQVASHCYLSGTGAGKNLALRTPDLQKRRPLGWSIGGEPCNFSSNFFGCLWWLKFIHVYTILYNPLEKGMVKLGWDLLRFITHQLGFSPQQCLEDWDYLPLLDIEWP